MALRCPSTLLERVGLSEKIYAIHSGCLKQAPRVEDLAVRAMGGRPDFHRPQTGL